MTATTAAQLKESLRQQIIAFVVAAAPSKSKSENAKTIAGTPPHPLRWL